MKISKASLFFALTIFFFLINGFFMAMALSPVSAPEYLKNFSPILGLIMFFGLPISFCLFLYFWAFGKK